MNAQSISLATRGYGSLWVSLLLLSAASMGLATVISPANDTTGIPNGSPFTLKISPRIYSAPVIPLTQDAGDQSMNPKGTFILVSRDAATNLDPSDIAFISCDNDMYGENISADSVFLTAEQRVPAAIVLFSTTSGHCTFNPSSTFQYTSIYTMIGANDSLALLNIMQQNMTGEQATIIPSQTQSNIGSSLVSSPTTTVAMIILYSITGVVTGLFLIIIATGAVRAHRHPERYGPRILGPLGVRQSRAKGLARAVLESIPIVKFGEKDDDKPPGPSGPSGLSGRDLEMGPNGAQPVAKAGDGTADTPGKTSQSLHDSDSGTGANPAGEAGEHASVKAAEPVPSEEAEGESGVIQPNIASGTQSREINDDGLSCSICTEDFVRGENIRVLPCNHKFHPDCIDPWLLNVSGTCPLCRIDLNPPSNSNPPDDTSPGADGAHMPGPGSPSTRRASNRLSRTSLYGSLPPPLTFPEAPSSSQSNRRSRYLDLRRLAQDGPEDRLQALRQLREVNQQYRDADPNRRRNRMSGLFRGFGIRSDRSGTATPPDEVPTSTPAAEANPTASEAPPATEATPATGRYPTRVEPIAPAAPAPIASPLPHMERDRIRNSRFFTYSYANPHIS